MHPRVLETLRGYLQRPQCEGRNRSMYRDTGGNTVGIGCQLESVEEALRLPWLRRDSRRWTAGEKDGIVRSEYARVHGGGNGSTGENAIVLPDAAIDDLFNRQAQLNESALRRLFSQWDRYPADAQLGMFHHSWIRSSEAGIRSWQGGRYATAVTERKWDDAGSLSLWEDLREGRRERHIHRRNDVLRMFHNAALVDATGGAVPVSMLFFPLDAAPTTERYPSARGQAAGAR